MELVEDVDNRLDQVILSGLMPKATFVALNTSDCNDDDSDQSEDTEALLRDSIEHETEGHDNNCCIENVEAIHEEGSARGETFQDDFD